jgi:hypothetical protein
MDVDNIGIDVDPPTPKKRMTVSFADGTSPSSRKRPALSFLDDTSGNIQKKRRITVRFAGFE